MHDSDGMGGLGREPQPGSGAGAPAGCGAEPREENLGILSCQKADFLLWKSSKTVSQRQPNLRNPAFVLDRLVGRHLAVGASSCRSCHGCCCCPRAFSTHMMLSDRKTRRQLLGRACAMQSPCCHDALGVFARRVPCGSTALRRAAAPYADGCE